MSTLSENIKKRRNELEMTQEDLARKTGYKTKGAISRIEKGKRDLSQSQIEIFAKALETTPAYLMGWEDQDIKEIPGVIPLNKIKKIPILGQIVCGDPILSYENLDGYYSTDPNIIDADFILYADGDSMIDAGIHDKDLVFFRQTPQVENGAIAAVLIDGQTTLKKFYKQKDSIILQPENPDYEPIIVTGERLTETKILGEMVGVYSKRNK